MYNSPPLLRVLDSCSSWDAFPALWAAFSHHRHRSGMPLFGFSAVKPAVFSPLAGQRSLPGAQGWFAPALLALQSASGQWPSAHGCAAGCMGLTLVTG